MRPNSSSAKNKHTAARNIIMYYSKKIDLLCRVKPQLKFVFNVNWAWWMRVKSLTLGQFSLSWWCTSLTSKGRRPLNRKWLCLSRFTPIQVLSKIRNLRWIWILIGALLKTKGHFSLWMMHDNVKQAIMHIWLPIWSSVSRWDPRSTLHGLKVESSLSVMGP